MSGSHDQRALIASVVIPAYNCADTVAEQIRALLDQEPPQRIEIVVADNGSRDENARVVQRLTEAHPEVVLVDARRVRGASAARNDGVAAAAAEQILFCDADDVVSPGWVAAMIRELSEAPVVGGWLEPFVDEVGDVTGRGRSAVASFGTTTFVISASMAIRRSAFEAVGGFDERWGPGEDIDISLRLRDLGYDIARADDAVVFKRIVTRPRDVWRQHFRYGIHRARAAAEHPAYREAIDLRATARRWAWLLSRLPLRWRDRDVLGPVAITAGRVAGSFKYRVFYP